MNGRDGGTNPPIGARQEPECANIVLDVPSDTEGLIPESEKGLSLPPAGAATRLVELFGFCVRTAPYKKVYGAALPFIPQTIGHNCEHIFSYLEVKS
jgi:hypothetical protein